MNRSTILGPLLALLCVLLPACSMLGTPDAVKLAHEEEGKDIRACLETYARRVQAIEATTPEEMAAKGRELEALRALSERIFRSHDELSRYLESAGLFGSDAERQQFLDFIVQIRRGDQ